MGLAMSSLPAPDPTSSAWRAPPGVVRALVRRYAWPEWRLHPWRHATVVVAVLLGVALAWSVHLINRSALAEFSQAVRAVNGEPDLELRAAAGSFDEQVYARAARHPQVQVASPVVEVQTQARVPAADTASAGPSVGVRVLGIDALVAPAIAARLLPRAAERQARLALVDPGLVFLNPAAQRVLGVQPGGRLELRAGTQWRAWKVAGNVGAGGGPLVVMDIAGAQEAFGLLGRVSRIDLKLAPGADGAALLDALALPAGVRGIAPGAAEERISHLSRAYRVNLTVLAFVALFTGGFLVFSVLALSVAKRSAQLALLGVLGLTARERRQLVLAEAAVLGGVGSAAGLAAGTGLASLALRFFGGDLGGGYFTGVQPSLQWSTPAAATHLALGVAAALAGAWLPARQAERLPPAQALKGLGSVPSAVERRWRRAGGLALLAAGALLALLPPVAGLPLFAYASVACLLLGGIACVPEAVTLALGRLRARRPETLLALERARRQRHTATTAVAGVVASLSLSVALTVMVGSFRASVSQWLDQVLPAPLYVRAGLSPAGSEGAFLDEGLVDAIAGLPGVARVEPLRVTPLLLEPQRPPVALIARALDDPARQLPLAGRSRLLDERERPDGAVAAFVSEAMVDLYDLQPGQRLPLPLGSGLEIWVQGVWRDYARQHGSIVIARAAYVRATGDTRVNDLALWPDAGLDLAELQARVRALPGAQTLEFTSAQTIRSASLRIFDRSFAVTYWLQAVAIAIGLFGIAATTSAQTLARRKEFGLLRHLGFTRSQVMRLVALEGLAWTTVGALWGTALGIAVSAVLVHVVNPQSFHWTMELQLPFARLAALALTVVAAGTATAWWAARAAIRHDVVLAVKEDW